MTDVSISYSGDDKYDEFNESGILDDKVQFYISVGVGGDKDTYAAGDSVTVTVSVPADATGNVTLIVNGEVISTSPVSDGTAVFGYVIPESGEFIVDVVYNGDDKYCSSTNSTSFGAVKANSTSLSK